MSSISLVNEGDNSELEEGASKIPFAVCDRSLRRGERGENKIACFQDGWPLLFISLTPFPKFRATVEFDPGYQNLARICVKLSVRALSSGLNSVILRYVINYLC